MLRVKTLTLQEMVDSSEEVFKFVRLHDDDYEWHWRFCHTVVDHQDMVNKGEVPLSAGFIYVEKDGVSFPEDIMGNLSTTLNLSCSEKDRECIPLLFEGCSEVSNGKYIESRFRNGNDPVVDGDAGEHRSSSS